jgi:hypothetical protein
MGKFMLTEPVLVQACIKGMLSSSVFSSFWTTLTYSKRAIQLFQVDLSSGTTNLSLTIGLFALIGIFGVCTIPFVGRYIDCLIPLTGVLIGLAIQALGQVIVTSSRPVNISCVIIPIFILDVDS